MRLIQHAEAKGWTFPRFSRDELIQFAVEEALRLMWLDDQRRIREAAARDMAADAAFARAEAARVQDRAAQVRGSRG